MLTGIVGETCTGVVCFLEITYILIGILNHLSSALGDQESVRLRETFPL